MTYVGKIEHYTQYNVLHTQEWIARRDGIEAVDEDYDAAKRLAEVVEEKIK